MYQDFVAKGAEVVAISPQDVMTNAALKAAKRLPFPVLSDGDLQVIHNYHIFHEGDPKRRFLPDPSAFVINSKGVIVWRYVGKGVRDRPKHHEILAALESDRSAKAESKGIAAEAN
jgi:peroxiredoxin